jgi:hypothetical protein
MRIIVAEEAATAGRIRIGSRDIVSNQSEAFQVRVPFGTAAVVGYKSYLMN